MTATATMARLLNGVVDADTPAGRAATPLQNHIEAFHDIIAHRRVSAVFQPIIDFRTRSYLAYEGLIRGPAGSELHSPLMLFALARSAGLNTEFERICREAVLREFAALRLPGRLFINVSISCLADPHFMNGHTARLLDEIELSPQQIVIELTENQNVSDFSALHDVLATYRSLGYQIAMDDLGEGFSNLRMWSEVRPEFVKIDRHFISNIADDALKFQLVRAMHDVACASGAKLVAEGIETSSEFTTVRDLGIDFGQGFLIARPEAEPQRTPTQQVLTLCNRGQVITFPQASLSGGIDNTARRIMNHVSPVGPATENDEIYQRFEQEPTLTVIPVVDGEDRPLGLINRHSLIDRFARPYRRELLGKKPCTLVMNAEPIIVDQLMPVQEIGQLLGQSEHHNMLDGFVITVDGRYAGVGSTQALMAVITDLQIRAARYANPLTQLPGNVPINEHIDRLLQNNIGFVAAYCDLNHFKPYNDAYGYRCGDQLIQELANVLVDVCDSRLDFVGHIGGDDFMLLVQSADWQDKLSGALKLFDEALPAYVKKEHLDAQGYHGEDRRGEPLFHPLPSLSIGCLLVEPEMFVSHYEVASAVVEAKRQAKKVAGSFLFVERRKLGSATQEAAAQETT